MKRIYCVLPMIAGLFLLPVFGGITFLVYTIESFYGQRQLNGTKAALRVCNEAYEGLNKLILKAWRAA